MIRNIQYVSIKRVLDNILDHPLMRDVDLDLAIRYVLRFTALHGYPLLFQDKQADVEIHRFRGELPCDLISIQQVRDKCTGVCLRAMTKTFNPGLKDDINRHQGPNPNPRRSGFPDLVNGYHNPMIHPKYMDGMDRWHDHLHRHETEMSFKTQGRIIYTSFPEGSVELSYKAIPVDEDGYPLLIDDENYLAALEAYIKVRVFTVKFDTGKITGPVLQNAQTDYAWLSALLMDTFTIPSVSEMESITRMWNTLIEHRHEFEHGFKQLGNVEYPYSHTRAFNRHAVDVELVHTPITEVVHKPAEQDKPEENKDIKHENILYADETGLDMYVDNKMLVIVTETNVDVSNNILSIN